jgi:hypothetical protein
MLNPVSICRSSREPVSALAGRRHAPTQRFGQLARGLGSEADSLQNFDAERSSSNSPRNAAERDTGTLVRRESLRNNR